MLAGIKDILIISTPDSAYTALRRAAWRSAQGSALTCPTQYSRSPDGLAQAFIIGEEFIGDDTCAMVLGDNIFYGSYFRKNLADAVKAAEEGYATIFGYYVNESERFGICGI